jgi:NAD(P)-dependent dehydrogenase (short-subunit alcohol dehydrogenase family)
MNKKVLIVGASRGLGFGLVKKYLSLGDYVIATERKIDPSTNLQKLAKNSNGALQIEILDINDFEQIIKLRQKLNAEALDILFVNAGVCDDSTQPIGHITTEVFNWVMQTNSLAPMRVIETFDDLVKNNGTIAVMTSGLGSISCNTTGGYELYRASKAALNMFMKSYAVRAKKDNTLLAMMPGWVRTDMGGAEAPLDVETSVNGITETIAFYQGKTGLKFLDYQNKNITW